MKGFLIILALYFSTPTIHIAKPNYEQDQNDILWSSENRLQWKDFLGNIPKDKNIHQKAEFHGEIKTIKSYWEDNLPNFEIASYFTKDKSWTITNDTITLEHEQIHFDIMELHTRIIRKSFDSLNKTKIKDFNKYQVVFDNALIKNKEMDDAFDDDVRFDQSKQKYWSAMLKEKLCLFEEYE